MRSDIRVSMRTEVARRESSRSVTSWRFESMKEVSCSAVRYLVESRKGGSRGLLYAVAERKVVLRDLNPDEVCWWCWVEE